MGLGDITYSCNVISPSDTGVIMKIIANDRVVRDTRFFDGRSRWFRRNAK